MVTASPELPRAEPTVPGKELAALSPCAAWPVRLQLPQLLSLPQNRPEVD